MPVSGYFDTPFGENGSLTPVPDAPQGNGSVSYNQGFGVLYSTPVAQGGLNIPRAQMNQLFNDITTALQSYQQFGVPPFITTAMNGGSPFSYAQYARVQQGGVVYKSLVSSNTTTPPGANWVIDSLLPGIQATQTVTGTNHSFVAADSGFLTLRSNSGTVMVDTLPGTSPGVLAQGWSIEVQNNDSSALYQLTVGSGANLNGSSTGTIIVGPEQKFNIFSDGANYWRRESSGRTKLAASTNFYVATTGNDTANGLTSGTAWATLQKAWNYLFNNVDLNGQTVTVNIADGTYAAGVNATSDLLLGQGSYSNIVFNGNSGTPSNVVINNASGIAFNVSGSQFTVQNLKISGAGTCIDGLVANDSGIIAFSNLVFGTCTAAHIASNNLGSIYQLGNYTIAGNAVQHLVAENLGFISLGAFTVTLTGTPSFSGEYATASQLGNILASISAVFSGSATGVRYVANLNGVINTAGGGANFFPGNSAGSTVTGGQYA